MGRVRSLVSHSDSLRIHCDAYVMVWVREQLLEDRARQTGPVYLPRERTDPLFVYYYTSLRKLHIGYTQGFFHSMETTHLGM